MTEGAFQDVLVQKILISVKEDASPPISARVSISRSLKSRKKQEKAFNRNY